MIDSVKAAYPSTWGDSTMALQGDWGVLAYFIGFAPVGWLSITYGEHGKNEDGS